MFFIYIKELLGIVWTSYYSLKITNECDKFTVDRKTMNSIQYFDKWKKVDLFQEK